MMKLGAGAVIPRQPPAATGLLTGQPHVSSCLFVSAHQGMGEGVELAAESWVLHWPRAGCHVNACCALVYI